MSTPSTQRRTSWIRPVGIAVAAALAVLLAIGPMGLLGGSEDDVIAEDTTTVTEPVDTTLPVDTTVPDETTMPDATTLPDETTVPQTVAQVLLATGSELTDLSGSARAAIPALVAFDDLTGGVVYQQASPLLAQTEGTDVYHLGAGGAAPSLLLAAEGDTTLRLMGVFEVEGSPFALVVERSNPNDVELATDVLVEISIGTGERREVGVVGGWETSLSAISWDGSRYIATTVSEGYTFLGSLDRSGVEGDWDGALPAECFDDSSCPRSLVATPDGTTFYFTAVRDGEQALVAWDRTTDSEAWFVHIGPGAVFGQPAMLGDTVVINQSDLDEGAAGEAWIVSLEDRSVTRAPLAGFADPAATAVALSGLGAGPPVEAPALALNGEVETGATACAGVDGAVVFLLADGARAMVGFEGGTFIRYISPEGVVFETADVSVDQGLPPVYRGTVDVDGTPLEITIVATSGRSFPDCDY